MDKTLGNKIAQAAFIFAVEVALMLLELAFPVLFSGNVDFYVHLCTVIVPLAAGAILLGPLWTAGLGAAAGIVLVIHAGVLPMDYYEACFANPLTILALALMGLFMSVVLGLACGFGFKGDRGGDCSNRPLSTRIVWLVLASIVIGVVGTFCFQAILTLVGEFSSFPTLAGVCLQIGIQSAAVFVVSLVCLLVEERRRAGRSKNTLRNVFARWLVVVVFGLLAIVISLSYTAETVAARHEAASDIDAQIQYFEDQIEDFGHRRALLIQNESELVVGKATVLAAYIMANPSIATSPADLTQIAQQLELKSANVIDGNGVLIGTMDGVGIGSYNFYDHPENARYLALLDGTADCIVEEPRASRNASTGELSGDVEVFAGVKRMDSDGFVMVSIDAATYTADLEAVSIDNLALGYQASNGGKVYVFKDDKVVTTNDPAKSQATLDDVLGTSFTEINVDGDTLLHTTDQLTKEDSYGKVAEYHIAQSNETYRVAVFLPTSEVYAVRTQIMIWNILLYVCLFAAVLVLAMKLLDNVVVRRVQETNDTLSLITNGDLSQTVQVNEPDEFATLSGGINATVGALKESIEAEAARIDAELATASAIQENTLPSVFPPFPDIPTFDLYATMDPAREVGGDFYDFFKLDDDRIAFVVADVSGKGIPAALFMMAAKTEIRGTISSRATLSEALTTANHNLCNGNETNMFVTAFAGVLDHKKGLLSYVNAGHNKPLMMHGGQWEWLDQRSGPIMGVFDGATYRQYEVHLDPGDEVFVYTDGVNEAFDPDDQLYGDKRLEAFLVSHSDLHPRRLLRALTADLIGWAAGAEQSDDVTMLALRYGIPPEMGESLSTTAKIENFNEIFEFMERNLQQADCPPKVENQVLMAVEELVANVCNYAYPDATPDAPGPLRVHFTHRSNPNAIVVEVGDDGTPFNPLEHEDPELPKSIEDAKVGGLGLMMTKKMMDDVVYVREGIANVTVITKRW